MLTIEKIKIYKHFGGDIDFLYRIGTDKQKAVIKERDWTDIDDLIQDLELIKNGLASDSYKSQTITRMKKVCDSVETQDALRKLVENGL